MPVAQRVVIEPEFRKKVFILFNGFLLILLVVAILGLSGIVNLPLNVNQFLVALSLSVFAVEILGLKFLPTRISLVKRGVIEAYRNSPIDPPQDMGKEIDDHVEEYTINYMASHIRITAGVFTSLFLIILDGLLMDLFNLVDFHLLGFTIFRNIGITGLFLIILYFYRSYAEDPKSTLNENLHNYKRVSATGRKGLN